MRSIDIIVTDISTYIVDEMIIIIGIGNNKGKKILLI